MFVQEKLTHSALFDLLRSNPKNRQHLDQNLDDYIRHIHGQRHFYIDHQTSEKHLNAFKYVDKSILARPGILSCLRDKGVTTAHMKLTRRVHTERRIPIPANMTLAGENT
jgi:hypothetical protein